MKTRHWVVTITAATLAAGFGGAALAGDGGGYGNRGHGGFGPKLMRELDLSETQRDQVREIMEATRPQLEALREQMHENRSKLRDTTPDEPNYSATVDEVSQQIGALTSELIRVTSRTRSDVYSVLTPEQRAKAAELEENREQRWAERKERRREHRRMHREDAGVE